MLQGDGGGPQFLRGAGAGAGLDLAEPSDLVEVGADRGRQHDGDGQLDVGLAGHDVDQVERHRLDLAQGAGLGGPVDLRHVHHPRVLGARDERRVAAHSHHPCPSSGSHCL
ncbi:hypothetical protein PSA01_44130 [Pseudonocardia saturnea]|uniref:Uncharacterized protein n=1 Tax=Pseudonocardia saturnea TaxID=33909 RepID=A0ABQ0S455_9PSEU|nr:hypothetical protein [Pseudonocardia autotrophica]BBG01741.1 hypothetical protein Pdca_29500 [Pseudonocardia autotrophica]GEC27384.1 hypothetical protein PSA01_44130 [Pseudonocardia saturnea]